MSDGPQRGLDRELDEHRALAPGDARPESSSAVELLALRRVRPRDGYESRARWLWRTLGVALLGTTLVVAVGAIAWLEVVAAMMVAREAAQQKLIGFLP